MTLTSKADLSFRSQFKPGDIGYITWMHGKLYAQEYGWNHVFEAYVAEPLSKFAQTHSIREKIWIAESDGKIVGTVAIVEASQKEAQLRWLLVDPSMRGRGVGKNLVQQAIQFSREQEYASIRLWTVSELASAAALYKSFGFTKVAEATNDDWGREVLEERYDLRLV